MSFSINVQNNYNFAVDQQALTDAAACVLRQENTAPDSAVTIVLTTDDEVRELNRVYRNVDATTDVLSFPAEAPPASMPDEPPYLGDTIIAYPYAAKQAAQANQDLTKSLMLLVVHSTLHLLGYDHDTPATREAMWTQQAAALETLGVPVDYVPVLENTDHE